MDSVPTDRRVPVRVILHAPAGSVPLAAKRTIDGHHVLVLETRGDGTSEGIVWTTVRQADAVVVRLSASPAVISAWVPEGTGVVRIARIAKAG